MTEYTTTSGGVPPVLDTSELRSLLASADGLLLGVDFDGTLTAITDDPAEPELSKTNREALRRLGEARNVHVAIISGRALSDLRQRVSIDGITYAGNHGLELRRGGTTTVHPAAERNRPAIQDLVERLENQLAAVDGCIVENKGVTTTVHYRQVATGRKTEVRETVRSIVSKGASDRIGVQPGKDVLELSPSVSRDKGSVLGELHDDLPTDWLTVYVGDDTTDEDAFGVLADLDDGLGVHVGDDATTDAERRLSDPASVEQMLTWVATVGVKLVR